MKFILESNIFYELLTESFSPKNAKIHFLDKGLISEKDFNLIKKIFLPKYIYWGCREKINPENINVILDSIYDVTMWFEKNLQYLQHKDIYHYTYSDIKNFMNDPKLGPLKRMAEGDGTYKFLHKDDNNIIVRVDDWEAAVYWAHKYKKGEIADGQWCIAAYIDKQTFNHYIENGPVCIFIFPDEKEKHLQRIASANSGLETTDLKNNLEKYIYTASFYNSNDDKIDKNLVIKICEKNKINFIDTLKKSNLTV